MRAHYLIRPHSTPPEQNARQLTPHFLKYIIVYETQYGRSFDLVSYGTGIPRTIRPSIVPISSPSIGFLSSDGTSVCCESSSCVLTDGSDVSV